MVIQFRVGSTTATVDGKEVTLLAAPVIQNKTTLVPVRVIAEALGQNVVWDEASQTITISSPQEQIPDWHQVPDPTLKPWLKWVAPITSNLLDRSKERLEAVIKQCGVANAPRYAKNQQGKNETYCNIFLWDVTSALGCEIPHWVYANGYAAPVGVGRELDANLTCDWLSTNSEKFGWRTATALVANRHANLGKPAVAAFKNPGGIGHVAVLRPGDIHSTRGVPIAQAGSVNFDDRYLADGFAQYVPYVVFYIHD